MAWGGSPSDEPVTERVSSCPEGEPSTPPCSRPSAMR